jgi:hypothetical protein
MRASPLINKRDALINKRDIIGLTKEIPPDILKRFIKLLMSTTRTTKEFYSTTNEFYTETLMTMAMQINSGCVQSSACDQRMILSPSGAVGGPLWVMPGPYRTVFTRSLAGARFAHKPFRRNVLQGRRLPCGWTRGHYYCSAHSSPSGFECHTALFKA